MVINGLTLKDYRNYPDFEIEFTPGINYFYGNNGQGKTNLIEALYFITHLRSFRTSKIPDLHRYSTNISHIRSNIQKQGVQHSVGIALCGNKKKVLMDQKSISYSSEYIRNFYSLLFAPDQLTLFKEYPADRRNFIDRVLFLADLNFFSLTKEFNRLRKQKNSVLRQGRKQDVDIWNQMLAPVIPKILEGRRLFVERVNTHLPNIFQELTGREELLQLSYRNEFEGKTELSPEGIYQFLSKKLDSEISKGFVSYGPQKDNFWMTLNEKKDRVSFSQGEYRISFLALQFTINQIIMDDLKFCPVLLLDDIFSELDENVLGRTIEYISKNRNQVFITSTSIPPIYHDLGKSFHIKNGELII